MPVDIEKEIKENFGFIKQQCNKTDYNNADLLLSVVLEKIWKKRHTFDGTNFHGWVATVVKNSYIDITRRPESKLKFYTLSGTSDISGMFFLKSEIDNSFHNELVFEEILEIVKNNFNKRYNTIFTMRYIDGYQFNEISEITGIDPLTARGSIHRIIKFLKSDKKLKQLWES